MKSSKQLQKQRDRNRRRIRTATGWFIRFPAFTFRGRA